MTKIVSLSDEAYNELKKMKSQKSFSEIVIELVKEKKSDNLMQFAGILTKEEGEKMIKQIYEDRKMPSRRFK